jgi:hypothetical protein
MGKSSVGGIDVGGTSVGDSCVSVGKRTAVDVMVAGASNAVGVEAD